MKYGCFDKPRPQTGDKVMHSKAYDQSNNFRMWHHFAMSIDCKYDSAATDPKCAGCVNQQKGAA